MQARLGPRLQVNSGTRLPRLENADAEAPITLLVNTGRCKKESDPD